MRTPAWLPVLGKEQIASCDAALACSEDSIRQRALEIGQAMNDGKDMIRGVLSALMHELNELACNGEFSSVGDNLEASAIAERLLNWSAGARFVIGKFFIAEEEPADEETNATHVECKARAVRIIVVDSVAEFVTESTRTTGTTKTSISEVADLEVLVGSSANHVGRMEVIVYNVMLMEMSDAASNVKESREYEVDRDGLHFRGQVLQVGARHVHDEALRGTLHRTKYSVLDDIHGFQAMALDNVGARIIRSEK